MGFIVFAIIVYVGSYFIPKNIPQFRRAGFGVRLFSLLLVIIGVLSACITQVDTGSIGIQYLFGKVQDQTLGSGLHFINPLYTVEKMDVRTQNYTMSADKNEGEKIGDDAIRVLSADGLEVIIDLTVLYHVNPITAPNLVRNIGFDYKDKIVRPITRTKIRDNAVYYDAVSLYSTKRDLFQQQIFQGIDEEFTKRGLKLENLLVRNINLPTSVKQSIEAKINAEQDAQKMQFVLQKERQEADRKRVEAQGISDYQNTISKSLTQEQLTYEQIKAYRDIATSQNAKVIIIGKGGGNSSLILDTKN